MSCARCGGTGKVLRFTNGRECPWWPEQRFVFKMKRAIIQCGCKTPDPTGCWKQRPRHFKPEETHSKHQMKRWIRYLEQVDKRP